MRHPKVAALEPLTSAQTPRKAHDDTRLGAALAGLVRMPLLPMDRGPVIATASLMVDLSSNNGLPNLKAHYKAGHRVIALKATEGTGYTWDAHRRLADEWHKLGGSVWHYHFARPGDAKQQAHYFLSMIATSWRRGDRVVLDVEVAGVGAAFVRDFIDHCASRYGDWPGVVYSFASFLTSGKIRPAHGWGLWLAAYQTAMPRPVAGWDRLTAWQFTNKAVAAGMGGPVDQSRLLDPPPAKPAPVLSKPQRRNIRQIIARLRRLLKKG